MSATDSIITHVTAARILEEFINELNSRHGELYEVYNAAISQKRHPYGRRDLGDSYKVFLLRKAVPQVHGVQDSSGLSRVYPEYKIIKQDNAAIDRALKVGKVLFWLEECFGSGVFAMVLQSPWEQLEFEAYNLTVSDTLEELSNEVPSLGKITECVYTDVWRHVLDPDQFGKDNLTLNYDIMSDGEIEEPSILESISPAD